MSTTPSKEYGKMTVVQLKTELSRRSLDITGKKAELIERLENSENALELTEEERQLEEDNEAGEGQVGDEDCEDDGNMLGDEEDDDQYVSLQDDEGEGAEEEEQPGDEGAQGEGEEQEETTDVIEVPDTDEQNEEESKEEKSDKKEEDKKTAMLTKRRRRVRMPFINDMLMDRVQVFRRRSLTLKPILPSDLQNDLLSAYLEEAQLYFLRFDSREEEKDQGQLEIQFHKFEHAKMALSELSSIKEGLEVKQLTTTDTGIVSNDRSLRMYQGQQDKVENRTLYLTDLPSTTTEEKLFEIFPTSMDIYLPLETSSKDDSKIKGYAYIEYKSVDEVKKVAEENEEITIDDTKVDVFRYQPYNSFSMSTGPNNPLTPKDVRRIEQRLIGLRKTLHYFQNKDKVDKDKVEDIKQTILQLETKLKQHSRVSQGRMGPSRGPHQSGYSMNASYNSGPRGGQGIVGSPNMGRRGMDGGRFGQGSYSRGPQNGGGGRQSGDMMNLLVGLSQLVGSPGGQQGQGYNQSGGYSQNYSQGSFRSGGGGGGYNQGGYSQGGGGGWKRSGGGYQDHDAKRRRGGRY